MNCKYCNYCVFKGGGICGGYFCNHPKIEESAEKYENATNKRISKTRCFIGFKQIKTTLRWCPFKYEDI